MGERQHLASMPAEHLGNASSTVLGLYVFPSSTRCVAQISSKLCIHVQGLLVRVTNSCSCARSLLCTQGAWGPEACLDEGAQQQHQSLPADDEGGHADEVSAERRARGTQHSCACARALLVRAQCVAHRSAEALAGGAHQ